MALSTRAMLAGMSQQINFQYGSLDRFTGSQDIIAVVRASGCVYQPSV